jgi:serine/threonine protein kinase
LYKPFYYGTIPGSTNTFQMNFGRRFSRSHSDHELSDDFESRHDILGNIGSGSYGEVSLIHYRRKGQKNKINAAMKVASLSHMQEKESNQAKVEVAHMADLKHPNIIGYYESFILNKKLYIIMEYANNGSMDKVVREHKEKGTTIPTCDVKRWLTELLLAVGFVHAHKKMHRDIKIANIFLHDNSVKLGDFGLAKEMKDSMASTQVGTPYYLAPELIEGNYSYPADVWACGVVLYELCTLRRPFPAKGYLTLITKIAQNKPDDMKECNDDDLNNLRRNMMLSDPNERWTVRKCMGLPWIQNVKPGPKPGPKPRPPLTPPPGPPPRTPPRTPPLTQPLTPPPGPPPGTPPPICTLPKLLTPPSHTASNNAQMYGDKDDADEKTKSEYSRERIQDNNVDLQESNRRRGMLVLQGGNSKSSKTSETNNNNAQVAKPVEPIGTLKITVMPPLREKQDDSFDDSFDDSTKKEIGEYGENPFAANIESRLAEQLITLANRSADGHEKVVDIMSRDSFSSSEEEEYDDCKEQTDGNNRMSNQTAVYKFRFSLGNENQGTPPRLSDHGRVSAVNLNETTTRAPSVASVTVSMLNL